MRLPVLLAVVAVLAMPGIAVSEGLRIEPGLWEFTTSHPDPMGGAPTTKVHRECVSDEEMAPQRFPTQMTGCKISEPRSDATSMSWRMSCPSPAGTMNGSATFRSTGTAMSGTIEVTMSVNGQQYSMKNSWKGHRTGDCQ